MNAKILGALLGFLAFRYVGLVVGFIVGFFIDKGAASYKASHKSGRVGEFEAAEQSAATLAECYKALGVPFGACKSDVKKAYHKKCKELHPDLLQSKGLSDAALEAVAKELRTVVQAYEYIIRHGR